MKAHGEPVVLERTFSFGLQARPSPHSVGPVSSALPGRLRDSAAGIASTLLAMPPYSLAVVLEITVVAVRSSFTEAI